ncbi:MAG TPA: hypothetical protein VNO52_10410 [Methylomirabilota bacterium]|nr:hypothetical protein [Methylomirabilota bacterium]
MPNPVGYDRASVHVEGGFTYEKWRDGMKAGRSFVSNGPLLRARANAFLPGHVFRADSPLAVRLEARLDGRDPIAAVERVRNGTVERVTRLEALTEISAAQRQELLQPWREAEAFWRSKLAAAGG